MNKTIINSKIKQLKKLIEDGNDVNIPDKSGDTPLLQAIRITKSKKLISLLLEFGANVNVKNNLQQTPLHLAVETNIGIVKLLLKHGADLELKSVYGRTPLGRATMIPNNVKIAKFLISQGAEISIKDDHGITPLHSSSISKFNFEIVRLLLDLQADPNVTSNDGSRPLHLAAGTKNNIKTVKLLISKGADINAGDNFGTTPFLAACETEKNIKIVKLLHKMGADISVQDSRADGPLDYANRVENNLKIIDFYLKNEYDVTEFTNKVITMRHLFKAVDSGNPEIMKTLLKHGADARLTPEMVNVLYEKSVQQPQILSAINVVLKHLIKLKSLNLVNDEMLRIWRFNLQSEEVKQFEEACKMEVEKLHEMICVNRNVRFSDLLTKNLRVVAVFLNVEEINEELDKVNPDERFPIYSSLLKPRIKKSQELGRMLAMGYKSLQIILSIFKMPDVVLKKIFSFLSGKNDLMILNSIFQN